MSALEAKTRFGQLLDRVARGEEVVITRHEKPVARLVPEGPADLRAVKRAVRELRALRARIAARPRRPRLSVDDVKAAVAQGRP